jgi:hypothetical protein
LNTAFDALMMCGERIAAKTQAQRSPSTCDGMMQHVHVMHAMRHATQLAVMS